MFERFERLDKDVKGSGLGLSIVKSIVERYNGRIWVEDRVKNGLRRGSVFIVLLPNLQW